MKAELRANGLHISGYVNVPGRESRPVMTPRGRVIEVIEQRAFERSLARAGKINMTLDHNDNHVLASTEDGTLKVKEDAVGLRAEAVVTDAEVVEGAKTGRLKGWSFRMRNVKDSIEQRAEGLPVRHVKDFDLEEITLVMNRIPTYSSTSIEIRAGEESDAEFRSMIEDTEYSDVLSETKREFDNSAYAARLEALKN